MVQLPKNCSCGAYAGPVMNPARGVWIIRCSSAQCNARVESKSRASCMEQWNQAQNILYRRQDGILPGDEVALVRGSRGRGADTGPGFERVIRARYLEGNRLLVRCVLLEDDPNAAFGPFKAGEEGTWHGESFIRPLVK